MGFNKEAPQAVSSTTWGINTEHTRYFNTSAIKRKPGYFFDLRAYPNVSPILIAIDGYALCSMRRLQGVCLFCEQPYYHYDFSFCFEREVWVLYSQKAKFDAAMQLARTIQLAGASKALVMLLKAELVRRNTYDFR